ncbi:MAG: hypothetical protein DI626_09335 [Micavibrio aeruginosavorus]|uniref:YhdP central domain-containing protein n=1 Tax=Micavibrio aeruginosavorus TaxID=349221 RepID=A0A2W4ZLD0_9BACT|nr:MAG: hypothetical protein DI626_09335 [Micavibrio aeruginosavorus]
MQLVRARDGSFDLFVKDKQVPQEADEKEGMTPEQSLAAIYKDMAHRKRGKVLGRLNKFQIMNASVVVRDEQYGTTWDVRDMDFVMERRREGVASSLRIVLPHREDVHTGGQPEEQTVQAVAQPPEEPSLSVDMVYRNKTDDFISAVKIASANPYILSRMLPLPEEVAGQDFYLSGTAEAAFDTNMKPTFARVEARIPDGRISVPGEYDAPITLRDLAVQADYKGGDQTLSVSNISGVVGDIPFSGKGEADFGETSLSIPLQISVEKAELAKIPPLFPKSEQDGQAFKWLGRNIQGGTFRDALLAMELTGAKIHDAEKDVDVWDYDVPVFKLDFMFEDATVEYHDSLMPAKNAKGKGSLDLATEVLEISEATATLGDIQGTNVNVKVIDLMKTGAGYVTVKADINGPVSTALDYIADEPVNMGAAEIGLDAAKVKGTIAGTVEVGLPTIADIPKEDVKVSVKGTLDQLEIPGLVKGLPLTGGPLQLATEEGGFRVTGNAKLAGRDVTTEWHQYFVKAGHPYSMQIKAKTAADRELRNHFGVDLDQYITGTMPVDVIYTGYGGGDADVDVKGDLTPMAVHITPFRFEKKAGAPGSLSAKASLKKDVLKELTGVTIESADFKVRDAKISFAPRAGKQADLSKGMLPDVTIGKTKMNASFDVSKSGVMAVQAKGSVFDLAPFLAETETSKTVAAPKKEKQMPMNITVTADRMLGKNDQSAQNAKGYLEMDDDGDITRIEYDALVGKAPLIVRFSPDSTGKRTFRLRSDDAGAVLNTFGLYNNVVGGKLRIYGAPDGNNLRGDIKGTMRMEDVRVVKAPALASLLSLMSLTGVQQLLGNEGLVFAKLESGFEWRFREAGNLLIIKDGKTSGSGVGLTFSGVLDRGKKTTDIAGTIIPMTEVNSILSKIPLVGNILGGSTGLIAATYTMKGPSSDPSVSINPLSVLAPGILRRILFEGGYESKIPDDDAPPANDNAVKEKQGESKDVLNAPERSAKNMGVTKQKLN